MPKRIQMTRQRPWREDHPEAVIVARPSRWGNPFSVEEFGHRVAVDKYRHYIEGRIRDGHINLEPLRGKDLACWCPPASGYVDGLRNEDVIRCHADVLLEIANGEASE